MPLTLSLSYLTLIVRYVKVKVAVDSCRCCFFVLQVAHSCSFDSCQISQRDLHQKFSLSQKNLLAFWLWLMTKPMSQPPQTLGMSYPIPIQQ